MVKECYQASHPETWTPCFKKSGERTCSGETCLVSERITALMKKRVKVDINFVMLLLHSTCRMSSLSQDNEEFRQITKT